MISLYRERQYLLYIVKLIRLRRGFQNLDVLEYLHFYLVKPDNLLRYEPLRNNFSLELTLERCIFYNWRSLEQCIFNQVRTPLNFEDLIEIFAWTTHHVLLHHHVASCLRHHALLQSLGVADYQAENFRKSIDEELKLTKGMRKTRTKMGLRKNLILRRRSLLTQANWKEISKQSSKP